MNPDDMRSKSPYESGGARPDKSMPGDRKKKSRREIRNSISLPKVTGRTAQPTVTTAIPYGIAVQDMIAAYDKAVRNMSFSFTIGNGASPGNTKEFASLGFAAGVVRGVRSFSVDGLGRLTGIHFKQVWVPGENRAECRRDEEQYSFFESKPTPRKVEDFASHLPGCRCGFYAYYDGSDDYRSSGSTITAVVEGYGSTVIGSRGFRCAKARIVALHIPADVKRSGVVARNYAEIPMFDSFLRMVQEFPPIGDEKTVKPSDDDFWTRDA